MPPSAALDLPDAHAAVQAAIAAGEPQGLRVLGYGEITLVVGWPTDEPAWALKRLPPFGDAAQADAYARLLEDYLAALTARDVPLAPTELRVVPGPGGVRYAYLVQPIAGPGRMLDAFLGEADETAGRAVLGRVVDTVARAVDAEVALDGQISNWMLSADDVPQLVDLSTPMLRDAAGRDRIDARLFTSVYPWPLRRPLERWVAPSILSGYHDVRTNLTDAASNLQRQNLDRWVPVLLAEAARVLDEPLTEADVRRYYRTDTFLWATTERLRRSERWWRRRRGGSYPMLLAPPGAIRPERTGGRP